MILSAGTNGACVAIDMATHRVHPIHWDYSADIRLTWFAEDGNTESFDGKLTSKRSPGTIVETEWDTIQWGTGVASST